MPDTKTISLMFYEFANDYISKGIDLESKEKRLEIAVLAWNFCYWGKRGRSIYIKNFREALRSCNTSEEKIEENVHEIKKLMKRKDKIFPDVRNQILESYLKIKGKIQVLTLSISEYDGKGD